MSSRAFLLFISLTVGCFVASTSAVTTSNNNRVIGGTEAEPNQGRQLSRFQLFEQARVF